MKDLLEQALDNEHIDMVIWLLQNDKSLLDHQLSDNTTCKDHLIKQQWLTTVLSRLSWNLLCVIIVVRDLNYLNLPLGGLFCMQSTSRSTTIYTLHLSH